MSVDLVSVLLRWLEFVALFQSIGAGVFLLLFRRTLRETAARIRFLILGSALIVAVLATGHYDLEAGRLSEANGMDLVKLREALLISSGASDALKNWENVSFLWAGQRLKR